MAKITSSDLLLWMQTYVRAVFADRLQKEGFVSMNGDDICWHRIVNQEIINTVFFYTLWSTYPVIPMIGYGIHPLFVMPYSSSKVRIPDYPSNQEITPSLPITGKMKGSGYRFFSPTIPVMVPNTEDQGLYTLDEIILPQMQSVRTIEECYSLHKSRYTEDKKYPLQQRLNASSGDLIDEAIYVADEEFYPYYLSLIERRYQASKRLDPKQLNKRENRQWIDQVIAQRAALLEGKRDEFLAGLERRKENTIALLKKKLGLSL